MRFASHFDFMVWQEHAKSVLTDPQLIRKVDQFEDLEVDDDLYYILCDSKKSYFAVLRKHSRFKTFYKKMKKDTLTLSELPALTSVSTHFSIDYIYRASVRNDVNAEQFLKIVSELSEMAEALVTKGSLPNKIKEFFNDASEQ